jgi:ribosome assembly protein 1
LSEAVLDSVCEILPPPSKLSRRALTLKRPITDHSNFSKIEMAVNQCDPTPGTPTVAYVCKFLTVKRSDIADPEMKHMMSNKAVEARGDTISEGDMLVALVRVLSGVLRSCYGGGEVDGDAEYYEIYGPKYDLTSSQPIKLKKNALKLYLLMGSSLVRVKSIPAGHICAAYNLSDFQLKTMTLCDTPGGTPLQGFEAPTRPLVKVNVEALKASETSILERGLQRLSLADAAVEVTATSKGERILACQGELHLEKSILDLKKTYCEQPIELRISDPIAEYGESTDYFEEETASYGLFYSSKRQPLRQTTIPPYNEEEGLQNAKLGRCRVLLPERSAALRIRTLPLSKLVFQCLKEKRVVNCSELDLKLLAQALGFLTGESSSDFIEDSSSAALFVSRLSSLVCSIDGNGNCIVESWDVRHGACVKGVLSDDIYVFEPKMSIPGHAFTTTKNDEADTHDTLQHSTEDIAQQKFEALEHQLRNSPSVPSLNPIEEVRALQDPHDLGALEIYKSEIRGSISAGFQLAMRSGPFFEEPVKGILVVIEGVEIAVAANAETEAKKCIGQSPSAKSLTPANLITGGMVVSATRQGIRCSLLSRPARVVEAHLRLTLHTSLSGLGPLYAVLSKRRGKVLSDTMVEGTDLILITANLPQSESFGLSQELLKQSSGEVTAPELVFSHFEVLKEDPFWVPTSEDEIEEFGEMFFAGEMAPNKSLSIIRDVRKRKGLLVDSSKIVVAAEKQRTLSKKK